MYIIVDFFVYTEVSHSFYHMTNFSLLVSFANLSQSVLSYCDSNFPSFSLTLYFFLFMYISLSRSLFTSFFLSRFPFILLYCHPSLNLSFYSSQFQFVVYLSVIFLFKFFSVPCSLNILTKPLCTSLTLCLSLFVCLSLSLTL